MCFHSCKDCEGKEENDCKSCMEDRTLDEGMCDCNPGFFEGEKGECAKCHVACVTCSGGKMEECKSCSKTRELEIKDTEKSEGMCNCMEGYYDMKEMECQMCSYTCITCDGPNTDDCMTCTE